ncbi:AraC family transcriptional regulator [Marinobacterium sp. AK62]|uniref:AraC family transcriptional regulator n=1 Tax=Marinobacterium alkalitolerans TaxID=1542925 RepID=A0ABS3Z7Y8_9GAMM|nr:AraC family transcriptional regulator [Marinobacterium alkalitolerans]MBP0047829.1 AraC family transcriptional regulator [Marinobacterium alkalitolerans]
MPVKRQYEHPVGAALAPHSRTLCAVIDQLIRGHEDVQTPIDNLALFRRESVTEPCDCVVEPSVVLVVQGVKQLLIGDKAYEYDPDHFLLNSLDLPAKSGVLDASPDKPALGLVFKLELNIMAELIAQYRLSPPRERTREDCAYIGQLTPELLEPFARLLNLVGKPDDIAVLEPLIKREIHYRLLKSDLAASLWKVVAVGSQSQKVARAIDWIKANYNKPLKVDQLAAHVQMSSSSLHHYFRQLTAKSPLQYQKWLRLSEARRLMLSDGLDAARASFIVGYESPSQFSREYSRFYGTPPKRDIENLRQKSSGIHQASA